MLDPSAGRILRAAAACAALLAAGPAPAQSWKPQQPVEVIIGSAAGSSPDIMARTIQRIWQEKRVVEVPINVVNRVGGGNTVAWNALSQRAGDGHAIMASNINLSAGHLTGTTTWSYRDFTSLGILCHEYVALAVAVDSPIKDGRDLLARLKADPTSVSMGLSSVAGGANHMGAGLVFKAAGIDVRKVRTVVFDSAAKVITATLGGHIDVAATSITAALRQVRTGKVRVLGVTSPRRLGGEMAQFPTWRELGADAEFSNYRGFIGPPKLSAGQVAFWEGALAKLDADPAWGEYLDKNELERDLMTGRAALDYMTRLDGRIREVLGDLGLLKQGAAPAAR
jgi:putative tricarboxylic transport membrane protein